MVRFEQPPRDTQADMLVLRPEFEDTGNICEHPPDCVDGDVPLFRDLTRREMLLVLDRFCRVVDGNRAHFDNRPMAPPHLL